MDPHSFTLLLVTLFPKPAIFNGRRVATVDRQSRIEIIIGKLQLIRFDIIVDVLQRTSRRSTVTLKRPVQAATSI